jgi:hypothetical protein
VEIVGVERGSRGGGGWAARVGAVPAAVVRVAVPTGRRWWPGGEAGAVVVGAGVARRGEAGSGGGGGRGEARRGGVGRRVAGGEAAAGECGE